MFEWTGSSLQEETLLRAEGLRAGPASLNWEDALLILEEMGSGRSLEGLTAIRCRHSSYRREPMRQNRCKTAEQVANTVKKSVCGGLKHD